MALAKKNSSFDVLSVMLNVLMYLLFYKRFSLACPTGMNFAPIVPTLRVPRYSGSKNASSTLPLETTMKPTAWTPSTSLAIVSLREPQDLMFHLWLPWLRSPLRLCYKFHHPLLLLLIFVASLLYKNPKWTKSSGILLVFLTFPPRHVGPCMRSPKINAQPKSSPTPPCLGIP